MPRRTMILPLEIINLIAKILMEQARDGTCANLNVTCRAIHLETSRALWIIQRFTMIPNLEDFVGMGRWERFVGVSAFKKYCQYLVISVPSSVPRPTADWIQTTSVLAESILERPRAVVVVQRGTDGRGDGAWVSVAEGTSQDQDLVVNLCNIFDDFVAVDVRFLLPLVSPGLRLQPAQQCLLQPLSSTAPLRIHYVRLSLHEVADEVLENALAGTLWSSVGMLASSFDLWSDRALEDAAMFLQLRDAADIRERRRERLGIAAALRAPMLTVSAANLRAVTICVNAFARALSLNPNLIAIEIEIRLAHNATEQGHIFRQQLQRLLDPLRIPYLGDGSIPHAARRSFLVRDSQHRYLAGLVGWREGEADRG